MPSSRLLRVVLLLAFVLPTAHAQDKDALARLVPAGTAIYVQASSLSGLQKAARDVVVAFEPGAAEQVDVESILAEALGLDLDLSQLDRTRPIALAVALGATPDAEPAVTLLVPALSADAFTKALSDAGLPFPTVSDGGYVSIALSEPASAPLAERASAVNPIALDLPAGDLVTRLDLERIIDLYRPLIEAQLGELEGMMSQMPAESTGGIDVAPIFDMYGDGARAFLDSADRLDFVLSLRGEVLEIVSNLTTLENSVLSTFASKERTAATDMARFLDPKAALSMVFGVDMAALVKRFQPYTTAMLGMYPEPLRASFAGMTPKFEELAALSGNAFAACGDFGKNGIEFSYYLRPRDARKLFDTYVEAMRGVPGIALEVPPETTVAGVPVQQVRLKMDVASFLPPAVPGTQPPEVEQAQEQTKAMVEAMYGKDGIRLALASKGGVTTIVVGGDDAHLGRSVERLGGGGGVPTEMQRRLEQASTMHPHYVVHYDIGSIMRWAGALTGGMAGGMSGGPAEMFANLDAVFTVWGGIDGLVWRSGTSCNVAELGRSFRAMKPGAMQTSGAHAIATADIIGIVRSLDEFARMNGGRFPDSLEVLVTPDVNGARFLDLENVPKDPWGNAYLYTPPTATSPRPRVVSFGADAIEGGTDLDADIDSALFDEAR